MTKTQHLLLKEISTAAVSLDWNIAFGGKSYGNRHLFRVNKIIRLLTASEGGNPFIAQAGGWVHDMALSRGSDESAPVVRKITGSFLLQFKDLPAADIENIIASVVGHETGKEVTTVESKIVHDADVIDKSGVLGMIRHIWKTTNLLKNRILSTQADLDEVKNHLSGREHQVFTPTARRLVHNLNLTADSVFSSENSVAIMFSVSCLAQTGLTSEVITRKLIGESPPGSYPSLPDQLNCRLTKYL